MHTRTLCAFRQDLNENGYVEGKNVALSLSAQRYSIDHLVGAGEHRWRHIEAEHIGGPAPVLLPLAVDFLTLGVKQAKVNGL